MGQFEYNLCTDPGDEFHLRRPCDGRLLCRSRTGLPGLPRLPAGGRTSILRHPPTDLVQDADLNLYPVSFLCPNGTVFNQEIFVCDWWSVQEMSPITELTPFSLSLGSMWIVKHLPVSTEQQRVPLAAPQEEVAPMAPMQESVRLPLLELTVLAQSATAGALDRGTQVLQDSLKDIYHMGWMWLRKYGHAIAR